MVEPWSNTLAKSNQEHNAPSHNNDNSETFVCRVGMVAPWRNTMAKTKQKQIAPFHNNDN